MRIVITSGYFDPIHIGHLECLELAKELGDKLVVIVNNDHQAHLKKGKAFMSCHDRMKIVQALECVDETFLAVDTDRSVCLSIEAVWRMYSDAQEVIFAKGGDRLSTEIPEATTCHSLKIKIVDGLGAKIRSSSDLTVAYGTLLK
ncbi:MAG TPA: cytidyltransferase [Pseudomonadales bacterium]|nr:cytidyltransferase [Pseudomonadales bacterium]